MKSGDCFRRIGIVSFALLLAACQTTGVHPTGLAGEIKCPDGPRQMLDCRGALQQYARDFKADLSFMQKAQVGLGVTSTKLTEADALSGDLIQHYYRTCTLYNACIITRQEYAAKTEKLQSVQLLVRQSLGPGGYGLATQQNIQINPPFGTPPPGGFPLPPPVYPPPGGEYPPFPGGAPPVGYPQPGVPYPQGDPSQQPGAFGFPPAPGGQPPPSGISVNIPPTQGGQPQDRVDSILNILREGVKLIREQNPPAQSPIPPGTSFAEPAVTTASMPAVPQGSPSGAGAPVMVMAQAQPTAWAVPPPQQDLDGNLRGMLTELRQEVARRNPSLASGQAVVGNFTEEGQPWSSPLGALLQERVATLVASEGLFNSPPAIATRGVSVKQVATVDNPNDPKALSALYNTDLAIAGTYRPQTDRVIVRLAALDGRGTEVAQTIREILRQAIPDVVAAAPTNAADTSQLLNSLNQLGPKAQDGARVEVTTNRPGAGANFRLGEEIKYLVSATMDGYLYLFHIDADKNILRIFPNQYQREARISAGAALEVPAPGAPFKFEASPPFGLETTFAIVTAVPLDEKDFQMVEGGFAKPMQEVPTLVATRGISVKPAESAYPPPAPAALPSAGSPYPTAPPPPTTAPQSAPPLVWNSVTVLIRP